MRYAPVKHAKKLNFLFLGQQLQRLLGLVLGVNGHKAENLLAKYILLQNVRILREVNILYS